MHNIQGQRKSVVLQGKLQKIGQEQLGKDDGKYRAAVKSCSCLKHNSRT